MKKYQVGQYTRISKKEAKNLYENGVDICFMPCKCVPFPHQPWVHNVITNKNNHEESFETFTNAYEYYNCCNQLGRYAAFYKIVEEEVK